MADPVTPAQQPRPANVPPAPEKPRFSLSTPMGDPAPKGSPMGESAPMSSPLVPASTSSTVQRHWWRSPPEAGGISLFVMDLAEAEFQLTDLLQQTNGAQLDERLDGVAAEMDGLEKDVEEMYKDLKAYVESLGFEMDVLDA